jgi:two-component system chemotaxis response regulator CheB
MPLKPPTIRILIADDSPTCRELLVSIMQQVPGLQVVGMARNGSEAVRLAQRMKPDVIAMDVHMPEMDGLTATRRIMEENPRPIVMMTADLDKNEQELTFNALQAGALSVIKKPTMYDAPQRYEALISQMKLMSEVKVVRRWRPAAKSERSRIVKLPSRATVPSGRQLVAIAASTGGPGALARILGQLPADFPLPILIVQHLTPGFVGSLIAWLDQQTSLTVRLARQGDEPQPGQVFIAPDNYHLEVNHHGLISLRAAKPGEICPSANILFQSVAKVYGSTAIGLILTGMGDDGADGLLALHHTGAHTIAQNEATCIVFGMPAVAIRMGAVSQVLPLDNVTPALVELL